jgi:hypothetical protein
MGLGVMKVREANKTTLVEDLNDRTTVHVVHFDPGDPVVEEDWFATKTAPSAKLVNDQDRPQRAHLILCLWPQPTMAALRTKAEAIRSAFRVTGRYLEVKRGDDDVTRFLRIHKSRIASAVRSGRDIPAKAIPDWSFDFWIDPYADGEDESMVM